MMVPRIGGTKLERVMGIDFTLVLWDKRKQWPLPGRCRRVLGGPVLAAYGQRSMSAF